MAKTDKKSKHSLLSFTWNPASHIVVDNMAPSQYKEGISRNRESHYTNEKVVRSSYLYDRNSYVSILRCAKPHPHPHPETLLYDPQFSPIFMEFGGNVSFT